MIIMIIIFIIIIIIFIIIIIIIIIIVMLLFLYNIILTFVEIMIVSNDILASNVVNAKQRFCNVLLILSSNCRLSLLREEDMCMYWFDWMVEKWNNLKLLV